LVDAPNEGKMLSRAYRFESCPDYYGLVDTIQRIEEV
jgi:hypothetical protein